ncbi:hypothetical protein [Streptococcus uberis]|uniref:hypothetical protein n=1 Tax=Streptococcus uberis TaxID=1349 RepID=UPI001939F603|nr:hypothetical protein [Streptococcus uberis]
MELIKILRITYISLSIYIIGIFLISSFKIREIFPGVVILWGIYFFFQLGYRSTSYLPKKNGYKKRKIKIKDENVVFYILSILSIIFSIITSQFYTGNSFISVVNSFKNTASSLYVNYQLYAQNSGILVFSFSKIPFILMNFYIKSCIFTFIPYYFLIKEKVTFLNYLAIINFIFAHIYFGTARGTNFEMFEIILLIIYILLKKRSSNLKKYLVILSLISIAIIIFMNKVESRGYTFDFIKTTDFYVENDSLLLSIFPFLPSILIPLYSYFGFGFYYCSTFISKVWLNNFFSTIYYSLPFKSFNFFDNVSVSVNKLIYVGPRWQPDFLTLSDNFGFLISFLLIYYFGFLTKKLQYFKGELIFYVTEYIIFLQFTSLLVGKFLITSSSSLLLVVVVLLIWLHKMFNQRIIVI